jgi:hypothetical protein
MPQIVIAHTARISSFATQLYVGFNVPYNNIEWRTPYFGYNFVVAIKQKVTAGFERNYFKIE